MSRRRVAFLSASVLLVAGCATAGVQLAASAPTITVGTAKVAFDGAGTVEEALKEAGLVVPAGRYVAVKTHKLLGPDTSAGKVLVNGTPTVTSARVPVGAVITVEHGGDVVEPVETVTVATPAHKGIASLYVDAKPGLVQEVRGAVSHEVLSQHVIQESSDGHLIAPRALALTFDDGPNPQWTPQVLSLLARAHVHATFCLIGEKAAEYPNLVKAIVAGGHTLCNHTWDHDEGLNHRSEAVVMAEMTKAQKAIIKASGGVAPKFFRAPGGAWSDLVKATARKLGMTPLEWNVDPRDWSRPGVPHIEGVVLATVHPGSIVLMHDGGGNRSQSVTALKYFLATLPGPGYGYQLVTVQGA